MGTLDVAKAKEAASDQTLKEAKEALRSLEAQHKELYKKLESASSVSMEAITEHGVKEESLKKAGQVLSTFTELFERKTPVAPAADEMMDKVMDVPSPMKSIEAM